MKNVSITSKKLLINAKGEFIIDLLLIRKETLYNKILYKFV